MMIGINSKEWKEIIHCIGYEADEFIKDYDCIPEDVVWNWYVAEEIAKKILKEKLIIDEDCVLEIHRMRKAGDEKNELEEVWSSFEKYIKEST
jgi:hypothetical protein